MNTTDSPTDFTRQAGEASRLLKMMGNESRLLVLCFLAEEGERHVDAVERRPVQLALPPRPVPERGGVAEGAHVHLSLIHI